MVSNRTWLILGKYEQPSFSDTVNESKCQFGFWRFLWYLYTREGGNRTSAYFLLFFARFFGKSRLLVDFFSSIVDKFSSIVDAFTSNLDRSIPLRRS